MYNFWSASPSKSDILKRSHSAELVKRPAWYGRSSESARTNKRKGIKNINGAKNQDWVEANHLSSTSTHILPGGDIHAETHLRWFDGQEGGGGVEDMEL